MLTVVSRAKKETRILFIVFVFFTKVNLLENSFVAESATGAWFTRFFPEEAVSL